MSADQLRTRRKLSIFGAIAVLAVLALSLGYLRIPQMFGLGQMSVSAWLPQSGGLGVNSRVTYHGLQVGKVTNLELADKGIRVELSLDRSADLPADVTGRVQSTSVIGENYLELGPVPAVARSNRAAAGLLQPGALIPPAAKDPVPVDSGTLLTTLDTLVTSVNPQDLSTTVDELDKSFQGTGDSIAAMLDEGQALVGDANKNLAATRQLISSLEPVLTTQRDVGAEVRSISTNLAAISQTLVDSDQDLRNLIAQGPAAMEQISAVVTEIQPTLPLVLANLAATGEVIRIYLPGVKQVLVIYPAVIAQLQAMARNSKIRGRTNQSFHLNLNDPGMCRTGFTGKPRSVHDLSDPSEVDHGWCKLPQDSQIAVRGVRNMPCPTSSRRAATAAECGLDFTKPVQTTLTSYDPKTGNFRGPDGKQYRIDLGSRAQAGRSPYATGLLQALNDR